MNKMRISTKKEKQFFKKPNKNTGAEEYNN